MSLTLTTTSLTLGSGAIATLVLPGAAAGGAVAAGAAGTGAVAAGTGVAAGATIVGATGATYLLPGLAAAGIAGAGTGTVLGAGAVGAGAVGAAGAGAGAAGVGIASAGAAGAVGTVVTAGGATVAGTGATAAGAGVGGTVAAAGTVGAVGGAALAGPIAAAVVIGTILNIATAGVFVGLGAIVYGVTKKGLALKKKFKAKKELEKWEHSHDEYKKGGLYYNSPGVLIPNSIVMPGDKTPQEGGGDLHDSGGFKGHDDHKKLLGDKVPYTPYVPIERPKGWEPSIDPGDVDLCSKPSVSGSGAGIDKTPQIIPGSPDRNTENEAIGVIMDYLEGTDDLETGIGVSDRAMQVVIKFFKTHDTDIPYIEEQRRIDFYGLRMRSQGMRIAPSESTLMEPGDDIDLGYINEIIEDSILITGQTHYGPLINPYAEVLRERGFYDVRPAPACEPGPLSCEIIRPVPSTDQLRTIEEQFNILPPVLTPAITNERIQDIIIQLPSEYSATGQPMAMTISQPSVPVVPSKYGIIEGLEVTEPLKKLKEEVVRVGALPTEKALTEKEQQQKQDRKTRERTIKRREQERKREEKAQQRIKSYESAGKEDLIKLKKQLAKKYLEKGKYDDETLQLKDFLLTDPVTAPAKMLTNALTSIEPVTDPIVPTVPVVPTKTIITDYLDYFQETEKTIPKIKRKRPVKKLIQKVVKKVKKGLKQRALKRSLKRDIKRGYSVKTGIITKEIAMLPKVAMLPKEGTQLSKSVMKVVEVLSDAANIFKKGLYAKPWKKTKTMVILPAQPVPATLIYPEVIAVPEQEAIDFSETTIPKAITKKPTEPAKKPVVRKTKQEQIEALVRSLDAPELLQEEEDIPIVGIEKKITPKKEFDPVSISEQVRAGISEIIVPKAITKKPKKKRKRPVRKLIQKVVKRVKKGLKQRKWKKTKTMVSLSNEWQEEMDAFYKDLAVPDPNVILDDDPTVLEDVVKEEELSIEEKPKKIALEVDIEEALSLGVINLDAFVGDLAIPGTKKKPVPVTAIHPKGKKDRPLKYFDFEIEETLEERIGGLAYVESVVPSVVSTVLKTFVAVGRGVARKVVQKYKSRAFKREQRKREGPSGTISFTEDVPVTLISPEPKALPAHEHLADLDIEHIKEDFEEDLKKMRLRLEKLNEPVPDTSTYPEVVPSPEQEMIGELVLESYGLPKDVEEVVKSTALPKKKKKKKEKEDIPLEYFDIDETVGEGIGDVESVVPSVVPAASELDVVDFPLEYLEQKQLDEAKAASLAFMEKKKKSKEPVFRGFNISGTAVPLTELQSFPSDVPVLQSLSWLRGLQPPKGGLLIQPPESLAWAESSAGVEALLPSSAGLPSIPVEKKKKKTSSAIKKGGIGPKKKTVKKKRMQSIGFTGKRGLVGLKKKAGQKVTPTVVKLKKKYDISLKKGVKGLNKNLLKRYEAVKNLDKKIQQDAIKKAKKDVQVKLGQVNVLEDKLADTTEALALVTKYMGYTTKKLKLIKVLLEARQVEKVAFKLGKTFFDPLEVEQTGTLKKTVKDIFDTFELAAHYVPSKIAKKLKVDPFLAKTKKWLTGKDPVPDSKYLQHVKADKKTYEALLKKEKAEKALLTEKGLDLEYKVAMNKLRLETDFEIARNKHETNIRKNLKNAVDLDVLTAKGKLKFFSSQTSEIKKTFLKEKKPLDKKAANLQKQIDSTREDIKAAKEKKKFKIAFGRKVFLKLTKKKNLGSLATKLGGLQDKKAAVDTKILLLTKAQKKAVATYKKKTGKYTKRLEKALFLSKKKSLVKSKILEKQSQKEILNILALKQTNETIIVKKAKKLGVKAAQKKVVSTIIKQPGQLIEPKAELEKPKKVKALPIFKKELEKEKKKAEKLKKKEAKLKKKAKEQKKAEKQELKKKKKEEKEGVKELSKDDQKELAEEEKEKKEKKKKKKKKKKKEKKIPKKPKLKPFKPGKKGKPYKKPDSDPDPDPDPPPDPPSGGFLDKIDKVDKKFEKLTDKLIGAVNDKFGTNFLNTKQLRLLFGIAVPTAIGVGALGVATSPITVPVAYKLYKKISSVFPGKPDPKPDPDPWDGGKPDPKPDPDPKPRPDIDPWVDPDPDPGPRPKPGPDIDPDLDIFPPDDKKKKKDEEEEDRPVTDGEYPGHDPWKPYPGPVIPPRFSVSKLSYPSDEFGFSPTEFISDANTRMLK